MTHQVFFTFYPTYKATLWDFIYVGYTTLWKIALSLILHSEDSNKLFFSKFSNFGIYIHKSKRRFRTLFSLTERLLDVTMPSNTGLPRFSF